MPNINPNSTNYVHSHEPNTNDLVQAMDYDPYGRPVLRIDDTTKQHTSTNRVKTSNQQIQFFNTFQYTKDPQIWDEDTTGTASSTFSQFDGCVIMEVGGSAGDEIIRQTRNVMPYYPGRQNELVFAIKFNQPESGIRRRIGLFNENNGFYFEDDGGSYSVVIRRNTAGGVVENRIARDDWNVDKLDGTGPSGITADATKTQMFLIEYEWYGAGIVEFKWVYENNSYPIHRFDHANIVETAFINTPFLPIRLELTNVAGTAGTHQMHQGSSALRVEGSVGPLGREENVSTPLAGVATGTANTFRPILSIRLRSDRLQGVALPLEFQAASLDNTALFYRVIRDATLTGADWNNVPGNSFCEYDYAATAIAGGEAIQTGYVSSTNQGATFDFPAETILQLGRNNMGTVGQTFTILAATVQANKDVFASLSWTELR